jgi:hypothetical protein
MFPEGRMREATRTRQLAPGCSGATKPMNVFEPGEYNWEQFWLMPLPRSPEWRGIAEIEMLPAPAFPAEYPGSSTYSNRSLSGRI